MKDETDKALARANLLAVPGYCGELGVDPDEVVARTVPRAEYDALVKQRDALREPYESVCSALATALEYAAAERAPNTASVLEDALAEMRAALAKAGLQLAPWQKGPLR